MWLQDNALQPILDIIELCTRNGVDVQRWLCKIFEDKDHIELLEAELNTLQGRNFDVCQRDDEEWWI